MHLNSVYSDSIPDWMLKRSDFSRFRDKRVSRKCSLIHVCFTASLKSMRLGQDGELMAF